MFVRDVVVQNQVGLHARPATFFIQKANEFKSSIWIEKEDRRVNADGADEQAAVNGLVDLVESGFADEKM